MPPDPLVGGLPVIRLQASPDPAKPTITSAVVAPGRGMMLLQADLTLPDGRSLDLIESPDLEAAAARLGGGPDDFAGNQSFAFGGAILLPYANRVRGRALPGRELAADIAGRTMRLPRNWGGQAPGAETYAMHGLLLDRPFTQTVQPDAAAVQGRLDAGDFGRRWFSRAVVEVTWRLAGGGLRLGVQVVNDGAEPLPLGIGWHPYFRIASGERSQVRLVLPAAHRLEVDNYDTVLPTGRILAAEGRHDFRRGQALGDLYLDDCFTGLERADGRISLGFDDPLAGLATRLTSASAGVTAVQVYAPPDRPIVVLEPQFNWPDPFGPEWRGEQTGMVWMAPGDRAAYDVAVDVACL